MLLLKVVKPRLMKMESLCKLHESFHDALRGTPAYMGVEITLSDIDTHTKTGEVYFPLFIGNNNDNDTTIVVNAEELFNSMHPYDSDVDINYKHLSE